MSAQPSRGTRVCDVILQQLGGNQFVAMTGASSLAGDNRMLSFRLKSNMVKSKGSGMTITLNGSDTYDLKLLKMRGFECVTLDERVGIHVEELRTVFTDMTGLDTRL